MKNVRNRDALQSYDLVSYDRSAGRRFERVAKVQNVNVENKKNESSAPKNYPAGGDPYCLQKGQPRRYRGSVTTDPKPFGISVQRRGLPNRSSVKSRKRQCRGTEIDVKDSLNSKMLGLAEFVRPNGGVWTAAFSLGGRA